MYILTAFLFPTIAVASKSDNKLASQSHAPKSFTAPKTSVNLFSSDGDEEEEEEEGGLFSSKPTPPHGTYNF